MPQTFFDHPHYERKSKFWTKYRDLFDGFHDVLACNQQYLWLHPLEQIEASKGIDAKSGLPKGVPLRQLRELRSRYLNLMEPTVSRWTSFLFRRPINVPDSIKDNVFGEDEYRDVNGKGTSFDTFIKDDLAKNYILFGRVIGFVDKAPVIPENLGRELELGLRPYMDVLDPLEVKNWQISTEPGRVGKLDWLQQEYQLIEPATPFEEPKIFTYRKVLWLKGGTYTVSIYKSESKLEGGQTKRTWTDVSETSLTGWSELPVAFFDGESWVEGPSEQQLILFNYLSDESSIANNQAYQRIIVTGNSEIPERMFFGENAVSFISDPDAKITVIEPGNIDAISNLIEKTIDRFFKVAFNQVQRLAGAGSKEAPGADSQKEAKDDLIAVAQTALTEIEDIINQMVQHYAKFKGVEVTERVTLDKKITIDDINQELAVWMALRDDYKRVESVRKAMLVKNLDELNLPDPEGLAKDIEETDFEKLDEEQNLALNAGRNQRLQGFVNGGSGSSGKTADKGN